MNRMSMHDVRGPRGFGLIELMLTVAVLGVVMLAIFGAFFRTNDESRRISKMVEFRQSARASVQLIERDVRMAGSGWGRNPVEITNGGARQQWWAITPGYGSSGPNDSLSLLGAMQAATTLAAGMPSTSSNLQVASVAGFATNDLCVVTDGQSAHMFQVTGINTASKLLDHATSSPYNDSGGLDNWPSGGYPSGTTQVYKVNRISYRIDSLNYRRPVLVRQEWGGAPQVVAYDLNKFQMWYLMQDSTLTRDPLVYGSGVALMSKVQPRIYTRVTDRTRPTLIDSVWAEIQPRTFN